MSGGVCRSEMDADDTNQSRILIVSDITVLIPTVTEMSSRL